MSKTVGELLHQASLNSALEAKLSAVLDKLAHDDRNEHRAVAESVDQRLESLAKGMAHLTMSRERDYAELMARMDKLATSRPAPGRHDDEASVSTSTPDACSPSASLVDDLRREYEKRLTEAAQRLSETERSGAHLAVSLRRELREKLDHADTLLLKEKQQYVEQLGQHQLAAANTAAEANANHAATVESLRREHTAQLQAAEAKMHCALKQQQEALEQQANARQSDLAAALRKEIEQKLQLEVSSRLQLIEEETMKTNRSQEQAKAQVQATAAAQQQHLEQLQAQFAQLQGSNQTLVAQLQQTELALADAQRERTELAAWKEKTSKEYSEHRQYADSLVQEGKGLLEKNQSLAREIEALQAKDTDAVALLERRVHELEEDIDSMNSLISFERGEAEKARRRLMAAREKLEDMREEMTHMAAQATAPASPPKDGLEGHDNLPEAGFSGPTAEGHAWSLSSAGFRVPSDAILSPGQGSPWMMASPSGSPQGAPPSLEEVRIFGAQSLESPDLLNRSYGLAPERPVKAGADIMNIRRVAKPRGGLQLDAVDAQTAEAEADAKVPAKPFAFAGKTPAPTVPVFNFDPLAEFDIGAAAFAFNGDTEGNVSPKTQDTSE